MRAPKAQSSSTDILGGYNRVAKVSGRVRAGCHAHVRRKFFDAKPTAPEACEALDLILEWYRVEWEAPAVGIVGTLEHPKMRRDKAGKNIAGLYSLVATCEANHVNPTEYITGVLVRIQDHPSSRIGELLPHRWRALADAETQRARAGPDLIASPSPS